MNLTQVPISMIDTSAGDAGKVLTSDGTSWSAASKLTSGTAVTLTTQSSVDFTGIPSWVKRITVMFASASVTSSSGILIKIGAGSIDSAGYISSSAVIYGVSPGNPGTATNTTGFLIGATGIEGSGFIGGSAILNLLDSNTWVMQSCLGVPAVTRTIYSGGSKELSGVLDRIRIEAGGGSFDAGKINIVWE